MLIFYRINKVKNSHRYTKTATAFALLMTTLATSALGEIVNLSNGDRITGKVLSTTAKQVVVQTSFGTVTIPIEQVAGVLPSEQAEKGAKEAQAKAGQQQEQAEAKAEADAKAVAAKPEAAPAAADPAAPEAKPREVGWIKEYRAFIKESLPEDLHMRFRGGVQYRETSSKTMSVGLAFDLVENFSELQTFKTTLYYEYATETPEGGTDSVTVDKYGIDTSYRVDFNETKTWYFNNILNYKVDRVRGIRNQLDEAATFGYRFDFDRYDLVIDVAPGPAVRYINAEDYDTHWVAMAVISEDLVWKFHSFMRFEQNLYAGFDLENPDKYSVNLKLALIANVSEVMDIALRYSYIYDSINATDAQKSEQILTLSFEFPFNWKN